MTSIRVMKCPVTILLNVTITSGVEYGELWSFILTLNPNPNSTPQIGRNSNAILSLKKKEEEEKKPN